MKRIFLIVFSFALFLNFSYEKPKDRTPDFLKLELKWVDSVFNALTPDQRITQLFMIAAYSNKDMKHVRETREIIEKYNVGGLIMMQGGPVKHAKLVTYYQSRAKTPLLLSIDGEWGLAMRLDSTPRYPKQMALGAIQNDSLIYFMGRQIAKECKRMGLHVNFAPVVDVNNNPANPVIGIRSFGEDKYKVAHKGYMYMQGMQDERVMANAKHFPGHGDTDVDSHKGLPLISHPKERLDSLELYPFKYLFERGLSSIMVAHLNIPALDTTRNLASTLSPKIVTDLLKKQMGFEGLIFTDALNMKGASAYFTPGVIDVKALQAGNDVLLFLDDVPKALDEIKKAIVAGTIKQEEIDERCKKILKAKFWCGLNHKQHVHTKNLVEELNTRESDVLNTKLAEATMTLLKNDHHLLPVKALDTLRIAEVSIGMKEENVFSKSVFNYASVKHFGVEHDATKKEIDSLFSQLKSFNLILMQINKSTLRPDKNFGVSNQSLDLIDSISKFKPTIGVFFNNPYLLNALRSPSHLRSVIMAYEYTSFTQRAAAEVIFGVNRVNGKLPVTTKYFKYNTGLENNEIIRVKFTDPSTMGVQKKNIEVIDSIANLGIKEKAYPGCQVVAIKDGKLFFQKSYGSFTYDSAAPKVTNQTIYDLASVTKISSSCLALMKLNSEKKFDYKQTLGYYLPELAGSNKNDLVIEEVLAHQAGLMAWIPFYLRTIDKQGNYKPGNYDSKISESYPVIVGKNLYTSNWMTDSMYSRIINSKLEIKGKYLYSDLGYYFMQRIIEKLSQKQQENYVADNFYKPMGLGLTYLPLEKYKLNEIAPTENDVKFRKQIVHGYVHDPGAAMMGGVAGHAGLFGTAKDLAILMQMYLNKGNYGGVQYLDSNVVKDFTSYHFSNNRRGLCFDKPEPDEKKDSPVTELCSAESYGHNGFTGTFTWVDPKNKLIVVFLSNRVYPDAEENKLAKLGIRGKIHRAFYEAVDAAIPLMNNLK